VVLEGNTMTDETKQERGAHAEKKAMSPVDEKRNKLLFVSGALLLGAIFVWAQFRDKAPPKPVEKKQIRAAEFPTPAPAEVKTVGGMQQQSATVSAPALVAPAVLAAADPLLLAAQRAPLMALNKRGGPAGSGDAGQRVGILGQDVEADDKGAFERRLKSPVLNAVKAGVIGDLNYVIPQATSIPCIMETAMQSDQPGFVSCVIPRDVMSANGRVVLLERGTQVTGEYRGGLKQGQVRLFVLWSRARTPSGVVVDLGSPATDALGRAGVGGNVDNHWFERFGSALLLSVVSDMAKIGTKAIQSSTGEQVSAGGSANQAAGIAVEQSINMPPTLHKHQGEQVNIFVARDLNFSDVYGLKTVKNQGDAEWKGRQAVEGDLKQGVRSSEPMFMSGGGNGRRSSKD
jgi:type IV secretion system protein VirB10